MRKTHLRLLVICCLALAAAASEASAKRALVANDFDRMLDVDAPVCSKDGRWVAYTVEASDLDADERKTALWMVNFEGTQHLKLTSGQESVSNPKFSPDGRYVSFLSARGAEAKSQIYVLDRQGGEAQALTEVTGEIEDYDWSPDGTRIVFSMAPGDSAPTGALAPATRAKTPKPIVIDRVHFKADKVGYLTGASRTQLYLIEVSGGKLTALTNDPRFDDASPVWSPDGGTIAYFSNHTNDPDRSGMQEIYLIEPHAGAAPRKLAEFFAPNKSALLFTPDGKRLVFTSGLEPKLNAYIQDRLTIVSLEGGKPQVLTERLDRALTSPVVSAEAGAVDAILEDDGSAFAATVRLDTGQVERRSAAKQSVTGLCTGGGHSAVVAATDTSPPEIYALESSGLRKLSAHNDALMAELSLGAVEDISFPSKDGTIVHGMLVKPLGYQPGHTYPTLVWIHGGPNGQDVHGLSFGTYSPELERQWFAAHGYLVLAINYRGSSGRGGAYARAIAADWGDKEVADLLAGVDYAVREKLADPARLGIGGWSYGGILTDYTIAHDARFKAAEAGAGSANQLSMYGSDQYVLQYNAELGYPWRTTDLWLKVSYPFFHADRIKTATLFLGGEKDFNVPVAGGEQMYEALRVQGVPTQLVIYPGQFHIFTRPSYIKDRALRFLGWFDRYLLP